MSRRSGLGRGLGALIPNDLVHGGQELFRELPLSSIEPNRFQPREHFDEAGLVALSDSIRELGVLQPILVRPAEQDRFELIAGERRWRAARKAGLTTIPAIVRPIDDTSSLEQALVENLHRSDLNALEEAAAYQQLMDDFGFTQEQVAARVGKSRPAIANTVRLLHLPAVAQRLLAEGRLAAGHARALLGTPDRTLQERLARRVADEGWTVRQVEEAIRVETLHAAGGFDAPSAPAPTVDVEQAAGPATIPASRTSTEVPTPVAGAAAPTGNAAPPPASADEGTITGPSPQTTPTPATIVSPAPAVAPPAAPAAERPLPPASLLELEQLLADHFETTVRINAGRGRGRITIEFADLADLERIYGLMVDAD